jgi:hypothetical protein
MMASSFFIVGLPILRRREIFSRVPRAPEPQSFGEGGIQGRREEQPPAAEQDRAEASRQKTGPHRQCPNDRARGREEQEQTVPESLRPFESAL